MCPSKWKHKLDYSRETPFEEVWLGPVNPGVIVCGWLATAHSQGNNHSTLVGVWHRARELAASQLSASRTRHPRLSTLWRASTQPTRPKSEVIGFQTCFFSDFRKRCRANLFSVMEGE